MADDADYDRDAYKRTCLNMLSTGVHKWGFVIYRCTYDDDELWNRYLAQLKSFCHDELVEERRAELLEQYLDWVVIEDRATLDNASRFEVRKHFNQWLSGQNIPTFPAKAYTNTSPIELPASDTVYTSTSRSKRRHSVVLIATTADGFCHH
ncbi:hypothetical protein Ct61P_08131 [Colletotrichum tofieldiae]|nr:hypothetical protein Ct61P_08131 [Colletotrichum tofieldiae]